jgi:hypothetical protein
VGGAFRIAVYTARRDSTGSRRFQDPRPSPPIFIGLAVAALVACVGQVRSYPLYPNPQVRREPAKVARLTGIVATVDGVSVAGKGNAFDLAPGCHVVTLVRTVGEGGEHEPWTADVPRSVYAFKMSAGHVYVIEHRVQMSSNPQRNRDSVGA